MECAHAVFRAESRADLRVGVAATTYDEEASPVPTEMSFTSTGVPNRRSEVQESRDTSIEVQERRRLRKQRKKRNKK